MGAPAMQPTEHEDAASDEARERIQSARVRDLAFLISRRFRKPLVDADVNLLARVLVKLENEGHSSAAADTIRFALNAEGVSAQKADQLLTGLFDKA